VKFHIPDSYGEFLENGFVKENDVFERKKIADSLSSIIATSDDPLVICLDAPWGEGKTSFLHMWMHQLEEKHIPVVYFDAFAHDHHQDPLYQYPVLYMSMQKMLRCQVINLSKASRQVLVK